LEHRSKRPNNGLTEFDARLGEAAYERLTLIDVLCAIGIPIIARPLNGGEVFDAA
jgi:hypothetical protein